MSAKKNKPALAPRKPRNLVPEPALLVCDERNGGYHFYIPDEAALFARALEILEKRLSQREYVYVLPPESPGFTEAEIGNLPPALQDAARQVLKVYESSKNQYDALMDTHERAVAAVKNKDGREAWDILRMQTVRRVSLWPFDTKYGG